MFQKLLRDVSDGVLFMWDKKNIGILFFILSVSIISIFAYNTSAAGGGTCTGFTLTLANNKTSYTQGQTLTYTYACASGYATYVEVQYVKPDSSVFVYHRNSNPSITTSTMSMGTSSLSPGNYTLRACFSTDTGCSDLAGSIAFNIIDTVPPTSPTWLTAEPYSASRINVSWGGMTDNVGVTSYKLKRNGTIIYTGSDPVYSDINLSEATSYSYSASAQDAAGNSSSFSTAVSASTLDATAPSVPASLSVEQFFSSQFNLSWYASTDNVGVAGYKIYRNDVQIGTTATPSYSDTGLSAATPYTYKIAAHDATGNLSAFSAPVSKTLPDTASPSVPSLSVEQFSSSQLNLSWSASTDNIGVTGYKIYRNDVQIGTTATLEYSDSGLSPATSYTYRVAAYDAAGNISAFSTVSRSTLPLPDTASPSAPSLSVAQISSSQLNLSWSASTDNVGVTGYKIYRNDVQIGTTATLAYSDSGLSPATSYTYKVAAYDAAGNVSSFSTSVSKSTLSTALPTDTASPSAPTSFSVAQISSSQLNLSWTASTDNVGVSGYKIYRNNVQIGTTATLAYSDAGLSPATSYTYKVAAYDAAGNLSSFSNSVSRSTLSTALPADTASPSAPTSFSIAQISSSQLNLSWSASTDNVGVTGYKIYRNDVQIGTTATLAYSDTGLSPATSYTYKVAAYDAVGNISAQTGGSGTTKPSEQTTTVVGPYIGSPTLTLGTNGTSVIVKWATDVPSNSRVSYGTASGAYPTYSTDTSCQTSGTAYVTSHCIFIGNLIPGNKYYYRIISAIQSSGASRTSDEYTFVVPALPQTTVPVTATSTTVTQTTAPVTQLVTTVATATNSTVTKEAYFSVTLGGRFCIGDKTVAPVMFKVTPSDGGYFTVPGTGEGTGAMFANKTVDIPSGTYNWTATTNSGYVSATAKQGTFTISKLSACVPAVTTGNLTTTTQPAPSTATQEQPDSSGSQENTVEPRVQTFTTYDAAASAMQTKVETEIPVDMPIQEKIQAIQEIRQNFAPAPQAKTVELGTTTISRIESPKAVIAAVNAILKNRHAEAAVIDTDGDGIADYDETRIYGTDSNDPDTNGDGITDGASILSGIDPKKEEMTPVVYEDPKKVSVAAIAPKDVLTVSRAAAKTVPTADGRMQKIESVTFSGKGLANSYVTLYFFSTPVIVTVKTDSSGNWEYTVDKEFENGEHKIYVAMTDSGGKILMKSSPIPFVKTANAVTLGTLKTGAETTGFFSGNMLWISIGSVVLLGILALFVIGIVLGKKTPTDEVIQTIK